MVGRKFARLLVVSKSKTRHKRSYWYCLCDCGNTCTAMGKYLRQGKKKSCGCLKRDSAIEKVKEHFHKNILPSGESAFNILYATYRCSAAKKGVEFSLTKEDVRNITKSDCFYCGKQPYCVYKPAISGGYLYSGIDRRDNDEGYVLGNVAPCCKMCNWMKNTYSESDFLARCALVTEHQNRKKLAEMTNLEDEKSSITDGAKL